MSNEKQTNPPAKSPAANSSVAASIDAGSVHPTTVVAGLTPEQFERLQRTIAYGFAMAGLIFNRGSAMTPTAKNTEIVKQFGDLVLEQVNAD